MTSESAVGSPATRAATTARESTLNSRQDLLERRRSGSLRWNGPALVLFSRLAFAILAQGLVAGIYSLLASPTPWRSAAPWWPVYGTLIDAGCLGLLLWFTRREGLRLFGLLGFDRRRWRRDVLIGAVLGLVALPVALGGLIGSSLLVFHTPQTQVYGSLPLIPALYSVLIFPAIWAMTEEMTYNGYLLPRLQVLSGSTVLAVVVVSFAWALQHIALPLTFDPRFMLFRFLAFIPLVSLATITYLRLRRLLPFILAHWLLDGLGALSGVLIPLLMAHS